MSKPENKEAFREELAQRFINCLEEKQLNWKKSWHGLAGESPHNAITRQNYRGINTFNLQLISMSNGWKDPRWITMNQIMDKSNKYHPNEKWHLQKGSKASYVEYWFPYDLIHKKALSWEDYSKELRDGRDKNEFSLGSKYTAVFNACQVDGMTPREVKITQPINQSLLIDRLVENMGINIYHDGGDRAFYRIGEDAIHLPTEESFKNEYAYNSVALHELAHSTGHPTRLDRNIKNLFGSENYAYEELIAEISSCFFSLHLESEQTSDHVDNHTAYVQSWIDVIKEKPETLIRAVKEAQSTATYMEFKAELITDQEYHKTLNQSLVTQSPTVQEQVIATDQEYPVEIRVNNGWGIVKNGEELTLAFEECSWFTKAEAFKLIETFEGHGWKNPIISDVDSDLFKAYSENLNKGLYTPEELEEKTAFLTLSNDKAGNLSLSGLNKYQDKMSNQERVALLEKSQKLER